MTFLSVLFLWALPLVAIPIAIHLLHRRQQRVIRWGAMQFLVDSTRRRRRIWRLDDWLLMLLRCAALLALVMALARPLVRAAWIGAETINTSFAEPLDPGRSTTVTIEHAVDRPGVHVVTCQAESRDELPADNEARQIVQVRDRVPILVVASTDAVESAEDEARFVLAALGRSDDARDTRRGGATFFEPTLIDAADFEQTALAPYFGIVFTDAPPLDEHVARQLAEFVERGGGLWLALGGDSDGAAFNRSLGIDGGLSPVVTGPTIGDERETGEFTALHPPEMAHPVTGLLGDTQRLDIQDARILRRWQLLPRRPDMKLSVLLESSRGEPLAVEHFVGRGRVIVQGFPLTRAWSNLTLCKLFVPYVHEWLRHLVQPAMAAHNLAINEPLDWRQSGSVEGVDASLRAPLQAPLTLAAEADREGAAYRYFGTVFPGDYQLTLADTDAPVQFYVQREPVESDLRAWSEESRNALAAVPAVRFAGDPLKWPADVAVKPATAPAWSWLLWGVAALIGVELLSICWFAWRKQSVLRLPAAIS